jgi:hypothetical protein
LALIVILGALSWPAMDRPMATQSLRSGADAVRAAWVQARVAAMNTGATFAFRYAPGGDHYTVECLPTPELYSDRDSSAFGTSGTLEPDPTTQLKLDRHLPDRVCFSGGQSATDSRAAEAATSGTSTNADAQLAWADPILFYPDGTTSTACIRVQNQYNRMIELSLRGLTGVATVIPIQDAPSDSPLGKQGSG